MAANSRSGFDTPVSIKAAVVREPNGPFVIEDARIVAIRPDEVLVRIHASGLCHTVKRRSKGTPDRRRRGTPFSDMMLVS